VYLGAAPGGIEALWAHTQPGGKGNGIRIIDIEGAWRFDHEDLKQVQGGVVGGTQSTALNWRNHGTAVIGVFGGDENSFGVTGISPNSHTRAISIFGAGQSSAKAIRDAADLLSAGDIVLIELHRPGPRHNFQQRDDQRGYIAIEWWEDDWAAIRYASNKGVIVVEAAGNGAENLDDPIYSVRPAGFPAAWTNPARRARRPVRHAVAAGVRRSVVLVCHPERQHQRLSCQCQGRTMHSETSVPCTCGSWIRRRCPSWRPNRRRRRAVRARPHGTTCCRSGSPSLPSGSSTAPRRCRFRRRRSPAGPAHPGDAHHERPRSGTRVRAPAWARDLQVDERRALHRA
jgi:hypothetical protein